MRNKSEAQRVADLLNLKSTKQVEDMLQLRTALIAASRSKRGYMSVPALVYFHAMVLEYLFESLKSSDTTLATNKGDQHDEYDAEKWAKTILAQFAGAAVGALEECFPPTPLDYNAPTDEDKVH